VSDISFDEDGVCNYCHQADELSKSYGTGTPAGEEALQRLIARIKMSGRGKKYDCVVGVSGGTDSSYMLAKAVEWGLRPLAVHYDNTWNSAIATSNIRKMTTALGVDLQTYVVDNREVDDIFRAFFLAGVPELDAATDIALPEVLSRLAAKHGVRYILDGHSFTTEGIAPIGKNYFDGKYVADIHRKYGTLPMRTFPNLTFWSFLRWSTIYRIRRVRPFWYMRYTKPEARRFLAEQFDWEDYGGHHLENRMTAFAHTVYYPQRFGIDNRNWSLAAAARHGLMPREDALRAYETPIYASEELIALFKKRLNLSDEVYAAGLAAPLRTFRDFKTYKRRFERLRPLFRVLANAELVPRSFYLKYCFPLPSESAA